MSSFSLSITWKISKADETAVLQYALRGWFTEEAWLFNMATQSCTVLLVLVIISQINAKTVSIMETKSWNGSFFWPVGEGQDIIIHRVSALDKTAFQMDWVSLKYLCYKFFLFLLFSSWPPMICCASRLNHGNAAEIQRALVFALCHLRHLPALHAKDPSRPHWRAAPSPWRVSGFRKLVPS